MKTLIGVVLLVLTAPIIVLFIFSFVPLLPTQTNIANGIKAAQIRKVKPGMDLDEVLQILGRPYSVNVLDGIHNIGCTAGDTQQLEIDITPGVDIYGCIIRMLNDTLYCCAGNRQDKENKRFTLTYTRKPRSYPYYGMLWIHFGDELKVRAVYAKRYTWFDDYAIYNYSWQWDESMASEVKGCTDMYINEKDFAACFN